MARLEDAALNFGEEPMKETLAPYLAWIREQTSFDAIIRDARTRALDRKPLAEALTTILFWGYLWGYHDLFSDRRAPTDLKRKRTVLGVFNIEKRLATQTITAQYKPLPPEEAIQIFYMREIMTREQFDELLDKYARREAFFATNVTLDNIERVLYPAALEALQSGTTLRDFQREAGDFLMSRAHTETVFRTNIMNAYNSGHMDGMYDPLVEDLIPAVQFVAIIDGRTTEICRMLHGQVIMKYEAASADLIPPLHYNCRSTVIPVWVDEYKGLTKGDIFDPGVIYADANAPLPMEGFGAWRPLINRNPGYTIWPPLPTTPTPAPAPEPAPTPATAPEPAPTPAPRPANAIAENLPLNTDEAVFDVLPGYSREMQSDMNRMLKRIAEHDKEAGRWYNAEGLPITKYKNGEKGVVNMPRPEHYNFINSNSCIRVHSHPSGGSFSGRDVNLCCWERIEGTSVVVGERNVYVLEFLERPEGFPANMEKYYDSIEKAVDGILHDPEFIARSKAHGLDFIEHTIAVLEKYVEENPGCFRYTYFPKEAFGL